MEFLLDPNFAYLFLVAGILLAIMALFAPGTGLLEVGAFFVLLLAGWGIYQLPLNLWALGLLLVGVFPFFLAVRKSRDRRYLVVALLAFVIGSAYLFQGNAWWKPGVSPIVALVVSVASAGFLWVVTTKVLEADRKRPSHDLRTILGAIGEAKTDVELEGSVQVARELWSATSAKHIPAGARIRVTGRDGLILTVEQVTDQAD